MRGCLLLPLLFAFRLCWSQDLIVTGKLGSGDTVSVYLFEEGQPSDTLLTRDGQFRFKPKPTGIFHIVAAGQSGTVLLNREFIGEQGVATINPDYTLVLDHPGLEQRYRELKATLDGLSKGLDVIAGAARDTGRSQKEKDFADTLIDREEAQKLDIIEKFVLENNNMAGVLVFSRMFWSMMDGEKLERMYDRFDTAFYKVGAMKLMKSVVSARKALSPGKAIPAGDFSGLTAEGKPFSLDSAKGKYIVVDFWGTWCGACIYGFPKMKQFYTRYKDKVEFLSIDCRDSEASWRAGLTKYQLPWPQLYQRSNGIDWMTKYYISAFPTKILLDPRGKVIQVSTGMLDDDFFKTLEKALKG